MKEIIWGKIPIRALVAVFYTNISIMFLGGIVALSFLVAELTQRGEKWMYVLYAIVFSLLTAIASFFVGFEQSKRLRTGRAMWFHGLTWPGTILPQSKSFFRFRGAHELGNGWVIATFQKVTKAQCLTDTSTGEVLCNDLFCVLTKKEALPPRPCLLKLEYDQRANIRATVIPEQTQRWN